MIENSKVERFGGSGQLARRTAVCTAGPGIAPGMVMGQNDAGAAISRGVGDDLPYRHVDRFRLAVIGFDMNAPGRFVDVSDP